MAAAGWLTRSLADVPAGDGWLSARERATLADLSAERRRTDWRLGRWAAKAALAAWSGIDVSEFEVVAAADGAPQALIGADAAPAALSLSHRGGRALAVVGDPALAIGCDLEVVEPRSGAFIRTWLAPAERSRLDLGGESRRARDTNLIWSAKEAAAKTRREGLRLDVRDAVVEWETADDGEWRPLSVRWDHEGITVHGWWHEKPGWVFAFVSEPESLAPIRL
jgi:4'-phosphopantetheinyl transferase